MTIVKQLGQFVVCAVACVLAVVLFFGCVITGTRMNEVK